MGGRWFFRLPLIALIWFSSTPEAEILVKELRYGRRGGLDLVCRHDELIQVLSERLGYSSGGLRRSGRHRQRAGLGDRCRPRGTCSVPYSQANWYCRGLSTCSGMPIERRPLHRLTCGSDFTNCLRVEYQCVKKRILTNVCSRSTYEAQTGHVTSPSFPNSYPLRRDCACALSASGGTGNVVVRVSFFLLRFGEPCGDWLSLKPEANDDAKRPLPMERKRCGYIPEMERVEARSVALRFHSDSSDQDMGFWIQFSASDPKTKVTIRCGRLHYVEEPDNGSTTTTTTTTTVVTEQRKSAYSLAATALPTVTGNYSSFDDVTEDESTKSASRSSDAYYYTSEGQGQETTKKMMSEKAVVWKSGEHRFQTTTANSLLFQIDTKASESTDDAGDFSRINRENGSESQELNDRLNSGFSATLNDTNWGEVQKHSEGLLRGYSNSTGIFYFPSDEGKETGPEELQVVSDQPKVGNLEEKGNWKTRILESKRAVHEFHEYGKKFLLHNLKKVFLHPKIGHDDYVTGSGAVTNASLANRIGWSNIETKSSDFDEARPTSDVTDKKDDKPKTIYDEDDDVRGRVVPEWFYKIGENDERLKEGRTPVEPLKASSDDLEEDEDDLEESLTSAGGQGRLSSRSSVIADDHHSLEELGGGWRHGSQSETPLHENSSQSDASSRDNFRIAVDSNDFRFTELNKQTNADLQLFRIQNGTSFSESANKDTKAREQKEREMSGEETNHVNRYSGGKREKLNETKENGEDEKGRDKETDEEDKETDKDRDNKDFSEGEGDKSGENDNLIHDVTIPAVDSDEEKPDSQEDIHSSAGGANPNPKPEVFYDLLPPPTGILRPIQELDAILAEVDLLTNRRSIAKNYSWSRDDDAGQISRPSWNLGESPRDRGYILPTDVVLSSSRSDASDVIETSSVVTMATDRPVPVMSYYQGKRNSQLNGTSIFGEHITWVILVVAVVGWFVFVVVLVIAVYYVRKDFLYDTYKDHTPVHTPHATTASSPLPTTAPSSASYETVGCDDVIITGNTSQPRPVTSRNNSRNNSNVDPRNENEVRSLPVAPTRLPVVGKTENHDEERGKEPNGKVEDWSRTGGQARGVTTVVRKILAKSHQQPPLPTLTCPKDDDDDDDDDDNVQSLYESRWLPSKDGPVGAPTPHVSQVGVLMKVVPAGMSNDVGKYGRQEEMRGEGGGGGKAMGRSAGKVELREGNEEGKQRTLARKSHETLSYIAYEVNDFWSTDGIKLTSVVPNDQLTSSSPHPPFPPPSPPFPF